MEAGSISIPLNLEVLSLSPPGSSLLRWVVSRGQLRTGVEVPG